MQSTTVRVNRATHQTLVSLAEATDSSIQSVLNAAVERYRREVFLKRTNQAYARLKQDSQAWAENQKELEAWESTVSDGL